MSQSAESPSRTRQAVEKSRLSFFGRVRQLLGRPAVDEATWQELEELLILADVGVATARELLERVKAQLKGRHSPLELLEAEITSLLSLPRPVFGAGRPQVVLVVGVNGSGKTTSIAKLAHSYRRQGKAVVLAAADTFRAAAIDQLRRWGERVGAPVVAHQPGADPGAVVYDAIQAARSRGADAIIVDTAGRLHTKYNLMEEMKKISRVASRLDPSAPHQVLLVLDATTGQNGLAQARHFTQAVKITGIFLAKLDGTAKGGIVLAIARELGIPILYIGTGEGVDDMTPFDPGEFAHALLT